MSTEEPTVEQALQQFKEDMGIGIGMGLVLPIILAIGVHIWIGLWYITLASFIGACAGAYKFGREEIAKKANQTIIRQAGK